MKEGVVLTYKFRLLPTKRQHLVLDKLLEDQRQLYNAALQERIEAYSKAAKSITYKDQCKSLTVIRRECSGWSEYPANLQRGTLKRLDIAFQGFFARAKKGKAGYPRFKSASRFSSFELSEFSGVTFEGRIRFKGLPGGLRVHLHRQVPEGKPLLVKFKRSGRKWHVSLIYRVQPASAAVKPSIGIDVGIQTLAALSNGQLIANPRHSRKLQAELRRRNRALSRCKLMSRRRKKVKARVTKLHARIAYQRATYLHQVSTGITRNFGLIAVEKLNVSGMGQGNLAFHVRDAAWSSLKNMLRYKAAKAGGVVIEVSPNNTSQDCSGCGVRVPKKLSHRWHHCPACGLSLDRDVNAARNILNRAVVGAGLDKQLVTAA